MFKDRATMNSVHAATKVNTPAVNKPGRACGMITEMTVRNGEAPSKDATSSISLGMALDGPASCCGWPLSAMRFLA